MKLFNLSLLVLFFTLGCASSPQPASMATPGVDPEILSEGDDFSDAQEDIFADLGTETPAPEPVEEEESEAKVIPVAPPKEAAAPAPVVEPAPVAAPTPVPRAVASVAPKVKKFSGFKKTKGNCKMRSEANDSGKSIKTIKPGKKLWLETENSEFYKVYRKKGVAFLNKNCF